jgi:hypothetical protein
VTVHSLERPHADLSCRVITCFLVKHFDSCMIARWKREALKRSPDATALPKTARSGADHDVAAHHSHLNAVNSIAQSLLHLALDAPLDGSLGRGVGPCLNRDRAVRTSRLFIITRRTEQAAEHPGGASVGDGSRGERLL